MIKILIVEKNLILLNHLQTTFNKDKDLKVVANCKEGHEVIEFLTNNEVDIILLDYMQTNGLVLTDQINKQFPKVKVIGFSTLETKKEENRIINFGAAMYLSKYETTMDDLIAVIKKC